MPGDLEAGPHCTRTDVRLQGENPYSARVLWQRCGPGGRRHTVPEVGLQPAEFGIGQLFEVVADAVIVGDAGSGRVVLWNRAAERLFGYSAEEAVGLPVEALVPPPLLPRHREGFARFAAEGATNLVGTGRVAEVPARHKDGHELWVELTLSPVDAAVVPGRFVLALVRDVTERRRAQAQVAASADQLEAANRSLREFLVMAAHDLRAPLAGITIAADILSAKELPYDEVAQLAEMIARQGHHLSQLIGDLAELGQIELGETEAHPGLLSVADVVAEACEAAAIELDASAIEVPTDLEVRADRAHVRRILVNYLTNARDHAGAGIAVTARAADDEVEICVADTGPGVPADFVPRLFDKFTRAAGRRPSGQGLGLAIVAGLARLNGGAAWYEPNRPTGARFFTRLPGRGPTPGG